MIVTVLSLLVSLTPAAGLYIWLRNGKGDGTLYRKKCRDSLIRGLVCALPILAVSGLLSLLLRLTRLWIDWDNYSLLYQALHNFIVLALAEELVKYLALRLMLRKRDYAYSWLDVVVFMTIIGIGFGLLEDVPYAIGASVITILVRGITLGHAGYGFVMGYFQGKRMKTGKKAYGVLGFLIVWLLHGAYDFSLSEELNALSDNFAFLAVGLAITDIVLVILFIRFVRRRRHNAVYTEPLIELET